MRKDALSVKLLVGCGHGRAQLGGRAADGDSCLCERGDLVLRLAGPARNDGTRVAHAAARRSGGARDERDNRLLDCLRRDEICSHLLGVAADLADHDDACGGRVGFGGQRPVGTDMRHSRMPVG